MFDRDVRAAVRHMLSLEHGQDIHTKIVEEMGVWSGSVRIDIAVINGELSGFELKSDRDTLERLPVQANLYSRVFDRVVLVAGSRHSDKALELIPDWWGLISASSTTAGVELTHVRSAGLNPSPDPYLVAQLLWKDEALGILDALGLAKGWKSKTAKAIHEHLIAQLPFPELSSRVRDTLKQRPSWLRQPVCDQGQMAIGRELDPSSSAA